jgi:hypothetical protein
MPESSRRASSRRYQILSLLGNLDPKRSTWLHSHGFQNKGKTACLNCLPHESARSSGDIRDPVPQLTKGMLAVNLKMGNFFLHFFTYR